MDRQMRRLGLGLCAMLSFVHHANAQVIPLSFSELVDAADSIVVAEAIDSRSEWVNGASSRHIVTRMTFRVEDTVKGLNRVLLPLEFLGGQVGNMRQEVSGVPRINIGDRAVLFISADRAASPIVGLMQGHFPINRAPDGTDFVTLHNRRAFSAVAQVGDPVLVSPVALPTMTLNAFRNEIGQLVR